MDSKNFKYNAFISYRHSDLDKYVAENLHRLIETYKMPASVVEKYNITDNNFRRVFRDQEELPLSSNLENPIIEALKESKYLIVICSPRLKESKWCKKEIESYIKMHGRNSILCVLVEGEPDESFPEILRYHEENIITKTGKKRIKKIPCEPLAMDVRGKDKKEIRANLKKELIRAIAPMYNLDYDDIKRRHEERELKRKANIFKTIAIASCIFAIYSFMLFSKIYSSNKQLKYDQSMNLASEASSLYNNDNRDGAIEKAYQSVTSYNGNSLPVTAKGIYTLTQSLGVYNVQPSTYSAISQLETKGVIDSIRKDIEGKYLLSTDNSGELVLWNLENEKRIKTIKKDSYVDLEEQSTFIGKKGFAYIVDNGVFDKKIIVDNLEGKTIKEIKIKEYGCSLNASDNGKYLEVYDYEKIDIYETENYTVVDTYNVPKGMKIITNNHYFDEKEENLIFAIKKDDNNTYTNEITLMTYNIKKNKVINSIKINAYNIKKMSIVGDSVIVLATEYVSNLVSNTVLTNYNFKIGKINYQKVYRGLSNDMETTVSNGKDDRTILIAKGEHVFTIDFKTGKTILEEIAVGNVVYIRPYSGTYLIFTYDGDVIWVKNSDTIYSWILNLKNSGYFNLHLNRYSGFLFTSIGYLGYSSTDNRIIVYNKLINNDYQKIDFTERKLTTLESKEKDSLIEEYNITNKGLVTNMFYSDDQKLLFIVYKNNVLEIYNTKNKDLIKTVKNINSSTNHFVTMTNDDEYIIKSHSNFGYVLNKDFEIIAYVNGLCDYKDGKFIVLLGKEYYEVPKYNEKEIIKKGKDYLELKKIN